MFDEEPVRDKVGSQQLALDRQAWYLLWGPPSQSPWVRLRPSRPLLTPKLWGTVQTLSQCALVGGPRFAVFTVTTLGHNWTFKSYVCERKFILPYSQRPPCQTWKAPLVDRERGMREAMSLHSENEGAMSEEWAHGTSGVCRLAFSERSRRGPEPGAHKGG